MAIQEVVFNRRSCDEVQRQCQNYKFGDEIAGKFPRFANKITMKNVSSGMKLWGVIAEVNKKDIVVSLPGGLRGLVRACDAFDPILDEEVKSDMENDFLSRTYHEGQLVSCTVLQVDDDKKEISKRKIWLSLRLSLLHKSLSWDTIQEGMVLSAYVKSIEDHGYILHFGLPSFTGFMPKDNQCESRNIKVSMSQLLQGIVKRVDRARKVVHLSSDPDMISKCVMKELKGISIDLLVPGMMVNALVQSTLENGIMFSFLTYFTGTVDVFNLDKTFPSSNWKNAYTKNMKFNARILFIDPSTRAVGLTLNPHLVNNKAPSPLVRIGDIFDQSKVVRVDKGSGLLLEIPTLPISTPAYVNVTDVADKEVGKLDKSFKEGSLVRVRVLGYRHLEGLVTGILKTSALEGLVFTHSDVKPGMVVKAKVIVVDSFGAIVQFASGIKALCPLRHMSEFEIAKPRKKFQAGVELVFRVLGCKSKRITVTHKKTLVKSKRPILSSYADASDGLISHGWITKIEKHGCFVRFYNGVQGFAPRSELGLGTTGDISSLYHVEQVVKCRVVKSIPASRRINLSFNMTTTRALENESLKPGSLVAGVVEHITPHAIIVDIDASSHMKGIISLEHLADHHGLPAQLMSVMKPGYHFDELLVLDIEGNNIVLTAKYSLINSIKQLPLDISQISIHSVVHKHKRKREANKELEVNQTVFAKVEIVKENYLVLSLPSYNSTIGYASLSDYNTQKLPSKQFTYGQSVSATVMALPAPATGGRLLLLLKSLHDGMETSSSKRAKKRSSYDVDSLVQAEIIEIKPLELRVKFGSGSLGRIHITEATDDNSSRSPFADYKIGQTLTARIVSKGSMLGNTKGGFGCELSIKPSLLKGSVEIYEPTSEEFNYIYGQHISGFVYKTDNEWARLTISRNVRAQLHILDSSCEPAELAEFQKRFYVGKALSAYVITVNKEKKLLRVVLCTPTDSSGELKENQTDQHLLRHLAEGSVVGGRICKILPGVGGLLVQIDPHHFGKVHFTELTDWLPSPLAGYHIGQFVKCKLLEINRAIKGTVHVDLSLRLTPHSPSAQRSTGLNDAIHTSNQHVDMITDLLPNMVVQGYVKNVSSKGCFIMLSRKIDAKILLSKLSDTFVENPEIEFPVGKLVAGRVLSVEPLSKRVEVTLKTSSVISASKSDPNSLSHINVGDIIHGRIRRVESYGLFISIDHTNVVGLCHVSELSDDHIDDLETKFKAGEKVTAKVLKVDKEKIRVSLGMKHSYFTDEEALRTPPRQNGCFRLDTNDFVVYAEPTTIPQSNSMACIENINNESENVLHPILADVESRARVPPLDVPFDDIESMEIDGNVGQSVENTNNADKIEDKNIKRSKKKAREEREREIRAAEERQLEKDIPRNADEFEKLIRSSPNSSFIWIKYMAFMLSLADIEKARSVAERALRTINIREESEKLNIWVAYFNLENEYGNPSEETVKKVFQRALQYCDPKRVHLALLGMYDRTEQHKLADELLDKMSRKFKHSCKIWLRKIQSLLRRNGDGIQSVVNRALLSLPRHKHIKFISHTAILEFKCGVPDRGRSMFERMLKEYPKRTDLWSIYLDQEIRLGDVDLIRALFERAISLSLPPKKMKFLFNKYLEYEKSIGDEERVEAVKKAAMDYVENTLA